MVAFSVLLSFVKHVCYILTHWLNMTIPLAPYGGVLSVLSVVFDVAALVFVFEERKLLSKSVVSKESLSELPKVQPSEQLETLDAEILLDYLEKVVNSQETL
jgi:hypothetical protein